MLFFFLFFVATSIIFTQRIVTIKANISYRKLGQKLSENRVVNSPEIVFSSSFQKLKAKNIWPFTNGMVSCRSWCCIECCWSSATWCNHYEWWNYGCWHRLLHKMDFLISDICLFESPKNWNMSFYFLHSAVLPEFFDRLCELNSMIILHDPESVMGSRRKMWNTSKKAALKPVISIVH